MVTKTFGVDPEVLLSELEGSVRGDIGRGLEPRCGRYMVLDSIAPSHDPTLSGLLGEYRRLLDPLPCRGFDAPSLETVMAELGNDCPNFRDVMAWMMAHLEMSATLGRNELVLPALLLAGPPGVGKTRFARRIGRAFGLEPNLFNAGGVTDNRAFEGTDRGWSSRHPSWLADVVLEAGIVNPLVVIDEIDKAGGSDQNGRIVHTILQMLEARENAVAWLDPCLRGHLDLSRVNWILTANDMSVLPAPLLDRVVTFRIEVPETTDFDLLLENMRKEIAEEFGVHPALLPELPTDVRTALKKACAHGLSTRRLRRLLTQLMAIGARDRGACH